ncbi:hypothetical protein [Nocardia sp. NPDC005745]|uniref:hypothetical protein n=1 Tax=Nocardia sp. NPDC005745 TaxID=3157061 RepID=UPI0034108B39
MRASTSFTRPAFRDPRWHERLEFSCVTTREDLRASFVIDFLTNLDVADCWVAIDAGRSCPQTDFEFTDSQIHLPIDGSQLSNVRLSNGLTIEAAPALHHYTLEYLSVCGRVAARLEFRARTRAADQDFTFIGDAASSGDEGMAADDAAPGGRIDQPMHVTGELRIDDSFFTVDCHSNRSHEWGTTTSLPQPSASVDEMHFSDELTVYLDTREVRETWNSVEHAYVVRKGRIRAVKAAMAVYDTSDTGAGKVRYEITDDADDTYRISGSLTSTGQMISGPNELTAVRRIVADWNGRTALGFSTLVSDIREIQRRRRAHRHSPNSS